MRAIILAGGKGTRLRPYTTTLPKPLVPVGGEMPILEIVIRQLAHFGFNHITIAVSHLANLIMAFFGDGSKWGIKIDYSLEDIPLSTIGPLTLIPDLPEDFLVMNGDIFCDMNYKSLYDYHINLQNEITVSTFKREIKIDFGVLKYSSNHRVVEFIEKPLYNFDVSMGIYCISRSVIDVLPKNQFYGFDHLMIDGIKNNNKIGVKPFDG
ncbi:MAG: sugar phosphate nucleotidyltransferase, partial [Spirochaetota bacterium]|nr:sugar phosphate nucleotidyltransferase [Spirochaetota bacterium]